MNRTMHQMIRINGLRNLRCFLIVFFVSLNNAMIVCEDGNELFQEQWNITKWWNENRDYRQFNTLYDKNNDDYDNGFNSTTSKLKFIRHKKQHLDNSSSSSSGSSSHDIMKADLKSGDSLESLESISDSRSVIPRTSSDNLRKLIYRYFTTIRSYRGDRNYYRKSKRDLREKFIQMGLNTALQSFWPPELSHSRYRDMAHNIIGIYPGNNRGTDKEQIIIIGAHYDTVKSSPGVDDNGSGSAAVLEIANLITQNNCVLDTTVIFILFDMEEDGLKGSKHFVKDYLIPVELKENGAKVIGAIIMDMILEHDNSVGSQSLGPIATILPNWSKNVKQNGYRGDFAAVWARKYIDTPLYRSLKKNWINKDTYKLSLLDPTLPKHGQQFDANNWIYRRYDTFLRSDHASFWYPTQRDVTINAVLITDLGPWRKNMSPHYHRYTDDTRMLSENNLAFLKNTVDSVTSTLLDMGNGHCYGGRR